jgi:hypothetical protein
MSEAGVPKDSVASALDDLITVMDTLETQTCRGVGGGENKDGIDG